MTNAAAVASLAHELTRLDLRNTLHREWQAGTPIADLARTTGRDTHTIATLIHEAIS